MNNDRMRARRLARLAAVSALGYPFGYACAILLGIHGPLRPIVAFALCFGALLGTLAFTRATGTIAAGTMAAFVASPDALVGSAPRAGLSRFDALVMRGDTPGALELIEQRLADDPADLRVRMRAAELYAGAGGKPDRAAQLLRSVQRTEDAPSAVRIQATYQLMDLYDGALATPERVLVELRWIVETFPGSTAARSAREALGRLKGERQAAS